MIHFEYSNGFSFDYVLAEGVPPSEVHSLLQVLRPVSLDRVTWSGTAATPSLND